MIYIGKTIRNSFEYRKRCHISYSKRDNPKHYFHRAIKKYGKHNFEWYKIYECDDENRLNEMERYFIQRYSSKVPYGYNLTDGGEGASGIKRSGKRNGMYGDHRTWEEKIGEEKAKEMKERWSKNRKGNGNPMYGDHRTWEEKIGEEKAKEMKDHFKEINKGKGNPMYGKKHSEKTKEIFRKINRGKSNPNSKIWYFINPDGKFVSINCLSEYCKENNLNYNGMKKVSYGKQKQHKGWKRYKVDREWKGEKE